MVTTRDGYHGNHGYRYNKSVTAFIYMVTMVTTVQYYHANSCHSYRGKTLSSLRLRLVY
ncbi:MAG: hypothetical protein GY821_09935 [Gammaproteobacteria bacterium]|nr:hypothetical protein [Gammaproteobacteria bacterium]MCP4474863.1 hypothetical protein [Gammaproteobacteria bacterium]